MNRRPRLVRGFFILLSIAAILAPSYFRSFENFELATLDFRFKIRPAQKQNEDIAVIEIANDTLEKIGRWPFKRSFHAAMIDVLSMYGARMIIFDILFSEPSEDDDLLIESTRNAGNVYYGFSFDLTQGQEAKKIDTDLLPGLKEACHGYGFINVTPDIDGKTRKVPIKIAYGDKIYPHLALLAASSYLGKDYNNLDIPVDERSRMLINFAGKWKDTFKHYSYVDILKSYSLLTKGEGGAVDLNDFRDKICFIGLTATGAHDLNPMPLEERYPGMGVHINVFNTVVGKNFLKRADGFVNSIILILFAFITVLVTLKAKPIISSIFILSAITVLCILGLSLFLFANIWIDLFYPVIALFLVYLSLTFYKYVSERQKRQLIEKELEVARKIQLSFLPEEPPQEKGLAIAAQMSPARQVGGDLYDFVPMEGGRLGVMIGDVSGKGVPAALYMAKAVSQFRFFSKTETTTKDTLTRLNEVLQEESKTSLFVTMAYVIYDPKSRFLSFSSGGHLPILLLKKDEDKCSLLEAKEGMPLGLASCEFSEESTHLSSGDILILYTDGVTEAMNRYGAEFGQHRLINFVEKSKGLNAKRLLDLIKDAVIKFSKGTPQHDDITIIVMEVR